jgi:hypothetical protein
VVTPKAIKAWRYMNTLRGEDRRGKMMTVTRLRARADEEGDAADAEQALLESLEDPDFMVRLTALHALTSIRPDIPPARIVDALRRAHGLEIRPGAWRMTDADEVLAIGAARLESLPLADIFRNGLTSDRAYTRS